MTTARSGLHIRVDEPSAPRRKKLGPGLWMETRVSCPAGAASAALGNGAGLSDFVLRKEIISARSVGRGMPAKVIAVPGIIAFELAMKWEISSTVQLPPIAFSAAE